MSKEPTITAKATVTEEDLVNELDIPPSLAKKIIENMQDSYLSDLDSIYERLYQELLVLAGLSFTNLKPEGE